jgi:hypothetical protein
MVVSSSTGDLEVAGRTVGLLDHADDVTARALNLF